MIKKWVFYSSLALLIGYLSMAFKSFELKDHYWYKSESNTKITYLFPSQNPEDYLRLSVPFTGKYFIGFREAIGFKESQGEYHKINSLGYMGKYQFGRETLQSIGISDSAVFLKSPKLQEKAFVTLLAKNKWALQDEIEKYSGRTISGVKITESGILAAAHLGGAGSVKRFLKSNGKRKCKDNYGTSVMTYMRDFGGYETAGIKAEANATVQ